MSITLGELKTRISVALQDPNGRTFTASLVTELVTSALVEVSRIAPEQFVEDLTPVENQLSYQLRSAEFSADPVDEIEVQRVEVWDASTAPDTFIQWVNTAAGEPARGGDSGWSVWNGDLTLPTRTVRGLVGHELDYVIRVWGYSPYVIPTAADAVINMSPAVTQAAVWYAKLEAIDMLLASRDLFTQWQTRSGNSDITPAGLMNQRSIADNAWRIKSRSIARLRSEV